MANTICMNHPKQVKQERNIPIDLLEIEILTRLPIESLLRFKLVSKQWLNIISNPRFTKLHLHRSTSSNHGTVLVKTVYDDSVYFLNHADHGSKSKAPVVHYMLNPNKDLITRGSRGAWTDLVDSSNGLICLITLTNRLLFFNPATRVCREVICPKGNEIFLYGTYSCLRAFGYSITNDEYKFLCVSTTSAINDVSMKAYVYTLRSNDDDLNNWKELSVDKARFPYIWVHQNSGNIINEKAHWTIYKESTYECGCILAFDLTNETFNELSLPQSCNRAHICVCDVEQNLSVWDKVWRRNICYVEVWMMMRYGVSESWSKIYNFELVKNRPVSEIIMPCAITREEGELFFLVSEYKVLLVKDLNARQPSYFEVLDNNYSVESIRRHVNSFVSPFLC